MTKEKLEELGSNFDEWSEEYFEKRRAERNRKWAEECSRNEKARQLEEYKRRKSEDNFEIHL